VLVASHNDEFLDRPDIDTIVGLDSAGRPLQHA